MTTLSDLARAVDRYRAGCRRDGECLVRDVKGYGNLSLGSRRERMQAHRAAYIVDNGPIPDGMVIRHTCDRPQCVAPSHLVVGTQAQNVRDMHERHRATRMGAPGEQNPSAVLTDALVATMRRQVREGMSIRAVSRLHGVGYTVARQAVVGETWRHVDEPPFVSHRKGSPSPRRTPAKVIDRAAKLIASGHSLSEASAAVGINRITLHRALRRAAA